MTAERPVGVLSLLGRRRRDLHDDAAASGARRTALRSPAVVCHDVRGVGRCGRHVRRPRAGPPVGSRPCRAQPSTPTLGRSHRPAEVARRERARVAGLRARQRRRGPGRTARRRCLRAQSAEAGASGVTAWRAREPFWSPARTVGRVSGWRLAHRARCRSGGARRARGGRRALARRRRSGRGGGVRGGRPRRWSRHLLDGLQRRPIRSPRCSTWSDTEIRASLSGYRPRRTDPSHRSGRRTSTRRCPIANSTRSCCCLRRLRRGGWPVGLGRCRR